METLIPPRNDRAAESGLYDYSQPYRKAEEELSQALVDKIAATRAFRRLEDIRFLGALDYCLIPRPNGSQSNVRFTRAQHSLGVASLAQRYLQLVPHSQHEHFLCVAAAMLHDIGHPPFSHTLEPVLKERFQIDHHRASEDIILGKALSDEVPKVLEGFGISPLQVLDVLNGRDDAFDHFFSGPINFDTIEGILRSRSYLRIQSLGITPTRVLEEASIRSTQFSRATVDAFWRCKDEMYNLVIRSKRGVFFDTLFQEALRVIIGELVESDLFSTESQVLRKFPILRQVTQPKLWRQMAEELLPSEIPFQIRRFYIEEEGNFFLRQDRERYRQSKAWSTLTLNDVLPA